LQMRPSNDNGVQASVIAKATKLAFTNKLERVDIVKANARDKLTLPN
jgi:hypothetical protein